MQSRVNDPAIRWRRAYNKTIVMSKLMGGERMPLVPYAKLAVWRREAERLRVSEVARSQRGFMTHYKKFGRKVLGKQVPDGRITWGQRRYNFIKRHMAQYRKNPTYRRYLALLMWAYKPPGAVPAS